MAHSGRYLLLFTLFGIASASTLVFAAGGSYLVDDATVAPVGHCQVESWARWLPQGSYDATSAPACSIGELEVTATLVGRGGPKSSHSEGLGLKHVVGDFEHDGFAWGVDANASLTNGKVAVANVYAPLSIALSEDHAWILDVDAGFQRVERPIWHALLGVAIEREVSERWRVIAEYLRNGSQVTTMQTGVRRTLAKNADIDIVIGRTHDVGTEQWLTAGLNLSF